MTRWIFLEISKRMFLKTNYIYVYMYVYIYVYMYIYIYIYINQILFKSNIPIDFI